jgi:acyl-CoA dehydrogenase
MNELNEMLGNAVERLFEAHSNAASDAQRQGWLADLWAQTHTLGLNLTLVPENEGGVGGTWEDAFAVLFPAGFHQIPLPIAESMLAARLCSEAQLPLPAGVATVGLCLEGSLVGKASDAMFTGSLLGVPWGRFSDVVVTVVRHEDRATVVVLNRSAAAALVQSTNLAGEPRDTLRYTDSSVLAAVCNSPEAENLKDYCVLARLPQIAGCIESALRRTIRYAMERRQFGQPIGKFQAIQQQLALFGSEAAAVACATRAACRAARLGEAGFQIAAAKLRANQAIGLATSTAHQVHAAIGFTREYPLHHATQRLWSWRTEFGNDRFWSERLGERVAARGAGNFWSDLTALDDEMDITVVDPLNP